MGRLYRPHIPFSVRVVVAIRDCYRAGINPPAREAREALGHFLKRLLAALSAAIGCEVADLRLDHDPALGARPKERRGLSPKTFYTPDANDPDHLFYRPHGPEHAGSHLIKTNVRGDHGQHPDRVLIKKNRRRENGPKPKRGPPMRSAGFSRNKSEKKTSRLALTKPKWPKRPFNRSKR